jgi:hypothetical protein
MICKKTWCPDPQLFQEVGVPNFHDCYRADLYKKNQANKYVYSTEFEIVFAVALRKRLLLNLAI